MANTGSNLVFYQWEKLDEDITLYTYILECHKHILDIHIGTVINKAIKYTLFCLIVLKYKLLTKVKTRALYFAL